MNTLQVQVLDLTYSNPALYSVSKRMMNVSPQKVLSNVKFAVMFVAAVVVVLYRKWNEYNCNERVQLFLLTLKEWVVKFVIWMKEVGIPNFNKARKVAYNAGVKTREFYEMISSPMFIVLQ